MNESVQKWLDELTSAPSVAIQKLVLGYAGVSAWSRSSLRESFVEIFQTHAEVLDSAVAAWLQERLMKLPPDKTPTLVWASHLQDLFSALAGLPLPQVARLLRDRLRDFRSWLRPLRTDESLDPEAAYLAALTWADTNQHLEGMWQRLALRRDREPTYYTDIGLLGLRKTRDERGQLPSKAPFLLLATLIDLADTGLSQKDWLLTTRALLGGYHYSLETWVREFEPVLEARQDAERGPEWLKKVLPQLRTSQPVRPQFRNDFRPAHTRQEVEAMIAEVKARGPNACGERLVVFLERERAYVNATGNPHYLGRTFNRLAEAARRTNPEWAVERAEESLARDPTNEFTWTALARCLWARGTDAQKRKNSVAAESDFHEAIDILWTARFRFWWNAYLRTELGRLCREAGDIETSELVYREAAAEFPDNEVARGGLSDVLAMQGKFEQAEEVLREAIRNIPSAPSLHNQLSGVLKESKRLDEAEQVLREAIRQMPDEPSLRDWLAGLLQECKRFDEAERIYRETQTLFPSDPNCLTGLAVILHYRSAINGDEEEREEARRLFRDATTLGSPIARTWLSGFDAGWRRIAERREVHLTQGEEKELLSVRPTKPEEMRPAQRLGRALLLQWQARRAESAGERELLFAEAEALLTLPDELTGECRTAFVEARGFLLLARDRATEARAYFEQQLAAFTRPALGLRLGFAEARARLGETLSDTEEAELASFGPEGSILPLVLKVVRLLESGTSDDTLRDLLLELYPEVRRLAGMPASELGEEEEEPAALATSARQPETPDTMMAQLLLASVFRPAAINTPADLQAADSIPHVRASLKAHRDDIFSVAEKLALAA